MIHPTANRLIVTTCLLALAPVGFAADQAPNGEGKAKDQARDPAKKESVGAKKPLDLRAPDVTTLFTPEQLQSILSRTLDENIEEIEVERERNKAPHVGSPAVPMAIAAPFWALAHPLQAWRIFAPIPPDRAKYLGGPADATDTNRRPTPPP